MMPPWEIWNRIMVMVGTAATVGALAVGVYSVIVPGTITGLLEQILIRIQDEPVLRDRDRFGISYFSCDDFGNCSVGVGKLQTTAAATVGVEVCTPEGMRFSDRKTYGMHIAESNFSTSVPYRPEIGQADLRLIVEHNGDLFTIFTSLKAEAGHNGYLTWNPPAMPRTESGDHSCTLS